MGKGYDKKAIYVITNLINHKQYVGQSIDPEQRFKTHCQNRKADHSLIGKAIQKYGKENFSLEIIGWFDNYDEMETEYIQKYRTMVPYGYNIQTIGSDPPHYYGEDNSFSTITKEIAEKIKRQLADYSILRRQIIKSNKVTNDIVRHINEGDCWVTDDYDYPIRPPEHVLNEARVAEAKRLLRETNLSQKAIGQKIGWNRSAITMINIGHNYFDPNEDYPIRK